MPHDGLHGPHGHLRDETLSAAQRVLICTAPISSKYAQAMRDGMETAAREWRPKVAAGMTTVEEVMKVAPPAAASDVWCRRRLRGRARELDTLNRTRACAYRFRRRRRNRPDAARRRLLVNVGWVRWWPWSISLTARASMQLGQRAAGAPPVLLAARRRFLAALLLGGLVSRLASPSAPLPPISARAVIRGCRPYSRSVARGRRSPAPGPDAQARFPAYAGPPANLLSLIGIGAFASPASRQPSVPRQRRGGT